MSLPIDTAVRERRKFATTKTGEVAVRTMVSEEAPVNDYFNADILNSILEQLKIMNLHLEQLTEANFKTRSAE